MPPLNVLVVALSARTGGGGSYAISALAALAKQPRLQVTVHATGPVADQLKELAPNLEIVVHRDRALLIRLWQEQWTLARVARNFDVVSMLGNFAMFLHRGPQLVTVQNAWYFTDQVRAFRRKHCPLRLRVRLAIETLGARASIRRATHIATVSTSMRIAIEADLGTLSYLTVVESAPPALPAPGSPPLGTPSRPYVLAVAHDDPHKEWDRLISVFLENRSLPSLVIVGRARRVRDLSSAGGRVRLLGEVTDRAALAALYAGAACYLAHSHFESFGLTPCEAMLAETPVVATNIPAHREVCGEFAHYYPPTDMGEMVAAVKAALGEPAPRDRTAIGNLGSWDDHAQQMTALLCTLADRTRDNECREQPGSRSP